MGNKVMHSENMNYDFDREERNPRDENQRRENEPAQQLPQQNQGNPIYQQNRNLQQQKKSRHEMIVQGICYTAIAALFYALYNRHQSKQELDQQYKTLISNTQSESERLYLENETFLERETSQFTILQLALITLAIVLILHVPKLINDFVEKNHWTSWFAGQITKDEYDKQTINFTQQELQKLQRDARFRQFERQRDQWREAENRMRDQGEGENQSDEENDDNLEGLIQNEDDSDYIEREFEKIDRHNERVRQRLRQRDTNSDISVRSQTVNRTNTAVFNPVQPQANISARSSMGPPPTAQPQLNRRTSSRADRDSESQSSRRSSQKFN